MDANRNDSSMVSAITPALHKLANSPDRAQKIGRAGGVESVFKTLVAHPEFEAHTLEALTFLDDLVAQDFDVSRLSELGAVAGIVASLKAHTGNAEIQLAGVRALIYFSYSEANIKAMVAAGVLDRIMSLLDSTSKDTVVAAMYLATSIVVVPENKAKLGDKGTSTLLSAISRYASDPVVRETAEELLSSIVSEDQVAEAVADFGIALDDVLENKSKVRSWLRC